MTILHKISLTPLIALFPGAMIHEFSATVRKTGSRKTITASTPVAVAIFEVAMMP